MAVLKVVHQIEVDTVCLWSELCLLSLYLSFALSGNLPVTITKGHWSEG